MNPKCGGAPIPIIATHGQPEYMKILRKARSHENLGSANANTTYKPRRVSEVKQDIESVKGRIF